ncbi:hypothetical protein Tco_1493467 [Tanacetum coccineum]
MRTTNPSPCVEKGLFLHACMIFNLEPFLFDFEFLRSLILHHLLDLNHLDLTFLIILTFDDEEIQRISLTGFPVQSVRSSNTNVLDSPCLLALIIGTSQRRQHISTSLIHIESCKSPTAELFDVDSGRISIHHCEY